MILLTIHNSDDTPIEDLHTDDPLIENHSLGDGPIEHLQPDVTSTEEHHCAEGADDLHSDDQFSYSNHNKQTDLPNQSQLPLNCKIVDSSKKIKHQMPYKGMMFIGFLYQKQPV